MGKKVQDEAYHKKIYIYIYCLWKCLFPVMAEYPVSEKPSCWGNLEKQKKLFKTFVWRQKAKDAKIWRDKISERVTQVGMKFGPAFPLKDFAD